jgi:iron complex transport system ATP-binding protein
MSVLHLEDVVVAGVGGDRLRVPALALSPGLVVVVGENGAGKSTLLDVLAGLLCPAVGRVLLDGEPLSSRSPAERARRVASLGQRPRAAPWLRVRERVAQGLIPRLGAGPPSSPRVHRAVDDVAAALGIAGLLDRPLAALSGGEQQRAHVARALIDDDAAVVLLDEPFAGLDEAGCALLVRALRARADAGTVVVVSVHDLGLAALLGGRVLGLRAGGIVVDGVGLAGLEAAAPLLGPGLRVTSVDGAVGVLRAR